MKSSNAPFNDQTNLAIICHHERLHMIFEWPIFILILLQISNLYKIPCVSLNMRINFIKSKFNYLTDKQVGLDTLIYVHNITKNN